MKICNKCGCENEDYAKFCVACGKSFNTSFKVNMEKPSLIEKIFYVYDKDELRYRLGKIKSFFSN